MSRSVKLSLGVVFFVVAILSSGRTCLADPTSSISTPLEGQFITGNTLSIAGTASDSSGHNIAAVEVSINGGMWRRATDTSGGSWSTWGFALNLYLPGLYTLQCRAVNDLAQVESPATYTPVFVSIPVHTISGSTSYFGGKPGNIVVGVFTDPDFIGDLVAYVEKASTGAYTITGVPDGTYYLGAVKTVVGADGPSPRLDDPFGAYGSISPLPVKVSGANKSGINIVLRDTKNNPFGNPASARTHYTSENGMQVELGYRDPDRLVTSVSVTGPGIGSPVNLAPDPDNNSRWISWAAPSSNVDLGTDPAAWPAAPLTYTFSATTLSGTEVYTSTVNQYVDQVPGVSPQGDVNGHLIFSWTLVPSAQKYRIELYDSGLNMLWEKADIAGSAFTYDGPALTDGSTYYYNVSGLNEHGLSDKIVSFVYHRSDDTTDPTVAVTYPDNGATVGGAVCTVTGTAGDNAGVQRVDISFDNGESWIEARNTAVAGDWSTWAFDWPLAGTGSYKLMARAVDTSNNVQATPGPISVTVAYTADTLKSAADTTPPTSSITYPAAGAILKGASIIITGTANDDASGISKVQISTNNGSTWTTLAASATTDGWATWSYKWTLPATGNYTLKTKATDGSGNVETPGAGVSVKVDKTVPTVKLTYPTNGLIMPPALSTYSITGSAADVGSGLNKVEVSTDGGSNWSTATGTTSWSYAWSPDNGGYNVKARSTDNAGNPSAVTAGATVTVDRMAPTLTISTPAANGTVSATKYTISGTAADTSIGTGVTKVEISINDGAYVTVTGTTSWSYSWTVGPDGAYTIALRATDKAGNIGGPWYRSFTVDRSIPSSAITAPANGAKLKGSSYVVKGTAVGGVGSGYSVTGVEVSTDGGSNWDPVTSGTTSWTYNWTLPADGTYMLLSRATNNFNVVEDPTHKTPVTVSVDSTNPVSAVTDPVADQVLKGASYTIAGVASDTTSGISKVQVSTNGGGTWTTLPASATTDGWATWSYKWTLPATGTYTIKTKATDGAGNVETPGTGVSVTVDKTVPTVKVTDPLKGAVMPAELSTYQIQGTAADAGSGVQKVEVTTDGGASWGDATGTTSWSYPWSPLADGSYTIKVRSTDNAGNLSAVTTGPTVKVDRTAPTAVITAPANGAFVTGASFAIKGTATDGTGSGLLQVDVSTDGGTSWHKATGTATWSYTWPLTGGDADYTIKVRATDKAGNVYTSSGITVTVDAKPASAITAPDSGATISAAVEITGTATDGAGTVTKVEVSTNNGTSWTTTGVTDTSGNGSWATWSYTWSTLPADGTYTIKSRATDNTNLVETPGPGIKIKVDRKAPTTTISSPAAGATVGASFTVKGAASDGTGSGVALVECSIDDGGTWQPATGTTSWTCDISVTASGPLTILARATDNVGNVQATPTSRAVKADIVAPAAAITSPADGAVMTAMSNTIKGTATDGTGSGVAKVEVSFDDGDTWKKATGTTSWTCAWPVTTTDSFDILARATDKAGNVGDTVVIYIAVSPQLLSGTWTYKAVPYDGGTTKTGTFTMSIIDTEGNGTITFGNTCHTVYSGGYFGMSAYFSTDNENYNSCTGYGDLWFDMTDLKHGGGDWTTDNWYHMTISR